MRRLMVWSREVALLVLTNVIRSLLRLRCLVLWKNRFVNNLVIPRMSLVLVSCFMVVPCRAPIVRLRRPVMWNLLVKLLYL